MPNFFTALREVLTSKKSAGDNYFNSAGWEPVGGDASGVTERNLLEANKEWVYVAVNKVATSVAGVRFKVMRFKRSGDDQEVFNGPLVDFLEKPGSGFTGKDFVYLSVVYKELTGNAFWERDKKGKVAPLIPTAVAPRITDGRLIGYKYHSGATQRDLALEDVLHDRYIDPARPYWGSGKLQKIAKWVDVSVVAGELLNTFFKNGAVFGGFIETEEETEARIKLIKAGLQNDYVGKRNFFKWGVLPKGAKASKQTASMAEMEMGGTDDRYRDKILATFGVPKSMLGLVQDVNRANAEAMQYVYAKETIEPIVKDLVEFLNVSVAKTLDTTGEYYFAYDDFIPANREIDIKEREVALNKQPYMTVNEVRASVGLPKVPGGDVVYGAAGTAPLGEAQPAPVVPPAPEPKKAVPARARSFAARETIADSIFEKLKSAVETREAQDAASHKKFVSRAEAYQEQLQGRVRDFNNRQEREVTLNISSITKAVRDIGNGDVFDIQAEVSVFVDFVTPILRMLMIEQGLEEYLAQEFPGQFDQASPRLSEIVTAAATRAAKSYNKTTATLLASALNEGIAKGESLSELGTRVRGVYEYSDAVRALTVAKTETFYIANQASKEAYRQSGVVKTIRWFTAEDERVCPWCGPQHGVVIGVEEVFFKKGDELTTADGQKLKLDYRTIDVPPLHANCRCFIRPETISV